MFGRRPGRIVVEINVMANLAEGERHGADIPESMHAETLGLVFLELRRAIR